MKTLLKNGTIVNVFTGALEKENILIENEKIIGVGSYAEADADTTEDISGKLVCPGFIDGHIHIESTMLTPSELAKISLVHGTTTVIADPHEIANVCGSAGIKYMLDASRDIPLKVYIMLPSCVPATCFDESGAVLTAEDLAPLYSYDRVLGLAEVMSYPEVINGSDEIASKIKEAFSNGGIVDGHAPLLSGKLLDKYIAAGIQSDHECSGFDEAAERIRKGQWVMIRQGTAARNLSELIGLFDEPFCQRCLLVTDDRHPADLLKEGHIDNIIRLAANMGKSVITGIQMATIRAAQCFGLKYVGAIAPGYTADLLVLNSLDTVDICDVYCNGQKIVADKQVSAIKKPIIKEQLLKSVLNSFYVDVLSAHDFHIAEKSGRCRVIKTIPDQLLTEEWITDINWENNNGVDTQRDILKISVIERHMHTAHKGKGFISGIGLKRGAVCSSVSHDSHNLVVVGTNDEDMALAANHVISMGGGCAAADGGKILADMPLPIAGLMADESAAVIAKRNERLRNVLYSLGAPKHIEPLMTMAFVSLAVIPKLKMTTKGLVDVNKQEIVSLYID